MLHIAGGIFLAYLGLMMTKTGARFIVVDVPESDAPGAGSVEHFNPAGILMMLAPSALLLWFLFF